MRRALAARRKLRYSVAVKRAGTAVERPRSVLSPGREADGRFAIPGPGCGVTREATVGALVGCRMPLPDVIHGILVPTACA